MCVPYQTTVTLMFLAPCTAECMQYHVLRALFVPYSSAIDLATDQASILYPMRFEPDQVTPFNSASMLAHRRTISTKRSWGSWGSGGLDCEGSRVLGHVCGIFSGDVLDLGSQVPSVRLTFPPNNKANCAGRDWTAVCYIEKAERRRKMQQRSSCSIVLNSSYEWH
jgi:hypothetical protein